MFASLSIDRFRGFQKLRVGPLGRINLILGKNNVGKTALLEAVFLLVGPSNPELPLSLSGFRGIEHARPDPEDLWGWLFYKKRMQDHIWLKVESGSPGSGARKSRQLRISVRERQEIPFQKERKPSTSVGRSPTTATTDNRPSELDIDYTDENQNRFRSKAYLKPDGIGFERGKAPPVPNSIFVSTRGGYSPDNAERYSKLEEVGEEGKLIPPLSLLEPRLKRLSVLVTAGGPMIHGDIGIGRLIPVPLMGEGMGRLTTLLLAISSSKGGVVLVDEIETGFHYSVMTQVWSAIAKAARESDVQLFASTHSFECINAAHESFSQSETYDLELHRLDRIDDDIEATHIDRDMLQTGLSAGLELR